MFYLLTFAYLHGTIGYRPNPVVCPSVRLSVNGVHCDSKGWCTQG